ncbi:MAG: hypothetical protein EPN70_17565 [Paraburkholderia sp.]|uniref:hypothetical protein n=1 Tax=Paraburkholderia sp. TaxID=1926495 RepID=UPI001223C4F2|nr:hypothetical protein [Paraburkholderia sp.]TAM02188.1 MAG: hypothetical protein EPN70_17565 [Paraburkholderia sp.]TAM28124.1 MAG: hypothetical protein EPN59_18355 [Paraburkholderia sp.]
MPSSSTLRTRIEQLEQRQPPADAPRLVVIVAMGDPEERPRLVGRPGHIHFEAVPEGMTLEDVERLYR